MRRLLFLSALTCAIAINCGSAIAESRCRLSPDECRIIARERYRLAIIDEYEASLPSNRPPFQQRMFLIDRKWARIRALANRLDNRLGYELARQVACDVSEEAEISGRTQSSKPTDCD